MCGFGTILGHHSCNVSHSAFQGASLSFSRYVWKLEMSWYKSFYGEICRIFMNFREIVDGQVYQNSGLARLKPGSPGLGFDGERTRFGEM